MNELEFAMQINMISEQRRTKRRLEIRHVVGDMLKEQQDIVVVMVVVNERNKSIVRRIKLLC